MILYINHTFPSSDRDDGRDAHETVPSDHLLLAGTTLTKLERFILFAVSDGFFVLEGFFLDDLSESSALVFVVLLFVGNWILMSSLVTSFLFVDNFCRGACKL